MGDEHVWAKRGSRLQLPRVPRPSRATLLRAIPSVGVVSLSLVGLLAAPAGSPPPPPAVAVTPLATDQPTDAATVQPVTQPTQSEQPPMQPPPCHPVGNPTGPLPRPSRDRSATLVTFSYSGEVWIYDATKNTSRILVELGMECGYWNPKFVNRKTIAFAERSDLFFLNLATGAVHKIKTFVPSADRLNDYLQDYAIDASGSTLAVLGTDTTGSFQLAVSSLTTDKRLFYKRLGHVCGCDGGTGSPPGVDWSADGSMLLVQGTDDQSSTHIYVFDRAGKNVIAPIHGDFGRWFGSTNTILYQQDGGGTWNTYNVSTREDALWLDEGDLTSPTVSPDGTKVAFNDEPLRRVVVIDATKAQQTLNGDHAYPLWLSNDRLAVSAIKACNCEGPGWETTGTVGSVSLSTGKTQRMRLYSSFDADVLF